MGEILITYVNCVNSELEVPHETVHRQKYLCAKLDLYMTTEKDPCFNIDGIIEDTDGGFKTNYLGNVHDCLRECNYHTDSELYNLQCKCDTNSKFSTMTVNCRSL